MLDSRKRRSETARVERVVVPQGSLIAKSFEHVHYADAYRARLPANVTRDVEIIARTLFADELQWSQTLLGIRDTIIDAVGLKTAEETRSSAEHGEMQPGASFGPFRFYQRSDNEILLGDDEQHLAFRTSIFVQEDDEATWVVLSTVVWLNNWLGLAYFVPVCPFHQRIVPMLVRYTIHKLIQRAGTC